MIYSMYMLKKTYSSFLDARRLYKKGGENLYDYPLPNPPAPKKEIEEVEKQLQVKFPLAYKDCLAQSNGCKEWYLDTDLLSLEEMVESISNSLQENDKLVQIKKDWIMPNVNNYTLKFEDVIMVASNPYGNQAILLVVNQTLSCYGYTILSDGVSHTIFKDFSNLFLYVVYSLWQDVINSAGDNLDSNLDILDINELFEPKDLLFFKGKNFTNTKPLTSLGNLVSGQTSILVLYKVKNNQYYVYPLTYNNIDTNKKVILREYSIDEETISVLEPS